MNLKQYCLDHSLLQLNKKETLHSPFPFDCRPCWRWSGSCAPGWSVKLANCRKSSSRTTRTTTSRTWRSRGCVIGSRWLLSSTTLAICIDHNINTNQGWIYDMNMLQESLLLPFTTKGTTFWWLNSTVSSGIFLHRFAQEEIHIVRTCTSPDCWLIMNWTHSNKM